MNNNTRMLLSRNKREGFFAGKTRTKYYRKGEPIYLPFKKRRTSGYFSWTEHMDYWRSQE